MLLSMMDYISSLPPNFHHYYPESISTLKDFNHIFDLDVCKIHKYFSILAFSRIWVYIFTNCLRLSHKQLFLKMFTINWSFKRHVFDSFILYALLFRFTSWYIAVTEKYSQKIDGLIYCPPYSRDQATQYVHIFIKLSDNIQKLNFSQIMRLSM